MSISHVLVISILIFKGYIRQLSPHKAECMVAWHEVKCWCGLFFAEINERCVTIKVQCIVILHRTAATQPVIDILIFIFKTMSVKSIHLFDQMKPA